MRMSVGNRVISMSVLVDGLEGNVYCTQYRHCEPQYNPIPPMYNQIPPLYNSIPPLYNSIPPLYNLICDRIWENPRVRNSSYSPFLPAK